MKSWNHMICLFLTCSMSDNGFCLSFPWLRLLHPGQCLVYGKSSINIKWTWIAVSFYKTSVSRIRGGLRLAARIAGPLKQQADAGSNARLTADLRCDLGNQPCPFWDSYPLPPQNGRLGSEEACIRRATGQPCPACPRSAPQKVIAPRPCNQVSLRPVSRDARPGMWHSGLQGFMFASPRATYLLKRPATDTRPAPS
jgi:hypothetical protein